MVVAVGVTVSVPPLDDKLKLLPSDPFTVTVEAFVAATVNVEVFPVAIEVGFAVIVIVGAEGSISEPLSVPHPESSNKPGSKKASTAARKEREATQAARDDNMVVSFKSVIELITSMREIFGQHISSRKARFEIRPYTRSFN